MKILKFFLVFQIFSLSNLFAMDDKKEANKICFACKVPHNKLIDENGKDIKRNYITVYIYENFEQYQKLNCEKSILLNDGYSNFDEIKKALENKIKSKYPQFYEKQYSLIGKFCNRQDENGIENVFEFIDITERPFSHLVECPCFDMIIK